MFHLEEKTEGERGGGHTCLLSPRMLLIGCLSSLPSLSSLPDKVVETGETIAAEALPVLISLLLVRLPRSCVRVARWCWCWFRAVVPVAVGRPVVVSPPAVTGPWLAVPLNLRLSVPGGGILVVWRLHVGSSETSIWRSDFSLSRSSLDKVVEAGHTIAAKGLPVLVGAPLKSGHSVKESWLIDVDLSLVWFIKFKMVAWIMDVKAKFAKKNFCFAFWSLKKILCMTFIWIGSLSIEGAKRCINIELISELAVGGSVAVAWLKFANLVTTRKYWLKLTLNQSVKYGEISDALHICLLKAWQKANSKLLSFLKRKLYQIYVTSTWTFQQI